MNKKLLITTLLILTGAINASSRKPTLAEVTSAVLLPIVITQNRENLKAIGSRAAACTVASCKSLKSTVSSVCVKSIEKTKNGIKTINNAQKKAVNFLVNDVLRAKNKMDLLNAGALLAADIACNRDKTNISYNFGVLALTATYGHLSKTKVSYHDNSRKWLIVKYFINSLKKSPIVTPAQATEPKAQSASESSIAGIDGKGD